MKAFLFHNQQSIRIYPNGFSLFKKDENETEKEYPGSPVSFLPNSANTFFYSSAREKSTLIVDSFPPLLIPKELYDENFALEYLKLQFDTNDIGKTYTDDNGIYTSLYFLNKETVNALEKLNIELDIFHQSTVLLQYIHHLPGIPEKRALLYIYVDHDFIDIILENGNMLLLINRFSYSTAFDILYHSLNILKQHKIDAGECQALLFNSKSQSIQELFKSYFPIVTPIS